MRGRSMKRFIEGADRSQSTLLPECLDDWVDESNGVRAVDTFVDALDLAELGFKDVEPAATGRPGYHPVRLLKLSIYGSLNRIQSSRHLERGARRNLEVIWLLHRLAPDDKTIADFRKDNGPAKLTSEMQKLEAYEKAMLASPDQQISLTDPDCRARWRRAGAAQ